MKLRLALLLLSVSQIVVVIGRTREPGNDDDNNKFNKRANLNGSKSEKIEPREFKPLEAGDDEIVVKLVQKQSSSGSRSMIDFKFETRPFPQFSLRYKKSEQETGTALFAARVGLLRLVELAPGNQLNESAKMLSLRSRRESGRSKWSSLKDGLSTQTINGVEVRSVSTSLKFNNHAEFGNLSITLQFSFASDSLNTTDGVKLTPSSVKYSVIIKV
jgi:hypothetical protein